MTLVAWCYAELDDCRDGGSNRRVRSAQANWTRPLGRIPAETTAGQGDLPARARQLTPQATRKGRFDVSMASVDRSLVICFQGLVLRTAGLESPAYL
jgi:hypothetical protein